MRTERKSIYPFTTQLELISLLQLILSLSLNKWLTQNGRWIEDKMGHRKDRPFWKSIALLSWNKDYKNMFDGQFIFQEHHIDVEPCTCIHTIVLIWMLCFLSALLLFYYIYFFKRFMVRITFFLIQTIWYI